jgi:glycosyltransferase involved in cell wall biosynthesis
LIRKKKILFVIPSLSGGGAEKVFSIIANNLSQEQFDIHFVVLTNKNLVYPLKLKQIYLYEYSRVLFAIPTLIRLIKKIRPEILFTTLTYQNVLISIFSLFYPKVKLVCRESTLPSLNNKKNSIPILYNLLVRLTYRKFTRIICQSRDMYSDMIKNFGIGSSKMEIIQNPVESDIRVLSNQINTVPVLITVAMLRPEKGIDRILNCLATFDHPFEYWIIGSGSEEGKIRAIIANNKKLAESVRLMGFVNDVPQYLSKANIYLQGSYYEGFPNVLLEAGVHGLPVVAFDCPGGTKEIINNGKNGFLVDSEADFSHKLSKAIEMEWDKESIRGHIETNFSVQNIVKQYENVFASI